jgi:hypothetical protein
MAENLWHNQDAYLLAIELGRYRAGARECVRALRRGAKNEDQELWRARLRGSFRRRHR